MIDEGEWSERSRAREEDKASLVELGPRAAASPLPSRRDSLALPHPGRAALWGPPACMENPGIIVRLPSLCLRPLSRVCAPSRRRDRLEGHRYRQGGPMGP